MCRCIPGTAATAAAFELAGANRLGKQYPHLPRIGIDSAVVPPTLLKAIGWVESNWQQFDGNGVPLVSFDFGYGIMQVTTGMAGAFGDPRGSLPERVQSRVAGDYKYNIASGARELARDFLTVPSVGQRDPTALEDWYYAVWAYNGWGWVNNPNNPQFTRQGTPATNPTAFPYQERVFYWVEHPPRDAEGHSLWRPIHVRLPSARQIGRDPHAIRVRHPHHEIPHLYGATYETGPGPRFMRAGASVRVHVRVYNSSGESWITRQGVADYALIYHWVVPGHRHSFRYDPHLKGIDVGSGYPAFVNRLVPIGGSIRLAVRLKAPQRLGRLRLEWDMVALHSGWFSYKGVMPGAQTVSVVGLGDPVRPYREPLPSSFLRGNHGRFVVRTSAPVPSTLTAGESYGETVVLFNPGSTTWGPGYRLHLLGSSKNIRLPVSRLSPCRTLRIRIQGVAPAASGVHVDRWRMRSPYGKGFGHTIRIRFRVKA